MFMLLSSAEPGFEIDDQSAVLEKKGIAKEQPTWELMVRVVAG